MNLLWGLLPDGFGGSAGGGYGAWNWPGGGTSIDYDISAAYPFTWASPGYGSWGDYGTCGPGCYIPLSPPPPPPPPQDIYAGPNPAAAPTAPRWMRTAPYITDQIHDTTNPTALLQHGPHIIEQPQPEPTNPIAGLTQSPTATAKPFTDNNTLGQQPLTSTGTPTRPVTSSTNAGSAPEQLPLPFPNLPDTGSEAIPTAAPQTATGSSNLGGGGGNPPTAKGDACEPDDGLSNTGALRNAAVQVHNLATPAARFNMSTVALAQADLPNAPLNSTLPRRVAFCLKRRCSSCVTLECRKRISCLAKLDMQR